MKQRNAAVMVLSLSVVGVTAGMTWTARIGAATAGRNEIPTFEYDPTWPKQLPNNWVTGNIGAMTIGPNDHIWVVHRPASTTGLGERYGLTGDAECCFPAPPVLEFDAEFGTTSVWPECGREGGRLGRYSRTEFGSDPCLGA